PGPESRSAFVRFTRNYVSEESERFPDDRIRDSSIARTVQVRLQLAILPGRRARRDNAKLVTVEVETGTAQHLAVSLRDHPFVEPWMQRLDVATQLVVHR